MQFIPYDASQSVVTGLECLLACFRACHYQPSRGKNKINHRLILVKVYVLGYCFEGFTCTHQMCKQHISTGHFATGLKRDGDGRSLVNHATQFRVTAYLVTVSAGWLDYLFGFCVMQLLENLFLTPPVIVATRRLGK